MNEYKDSLTYLRNNVVITDNKQKNKIDRCTEILFQLLNDLETGELSDGYHTFNELYYHRTILFSVICNQNKDIAWKSKLHSDGTMYDGMFIVGINTPEGQYSYHYDINLWSLFDVKKLDKAPEYDGHLPKDIERLKSIVKGR